MINPSLVLLFNRQRFQKIPTGKLIARPRETYFPSKTAIYFTSRFISGKSSCIYKTTFYLSLLSSVTSSVTVTVTTVVPVLVLSPRLPITTPPTTMSALRWWWVVRIPVWLAAMVSIHRPVLVSPVSPVILLRSPA